MEKSKFTYRHLVALGQSSPTSPLRVIALIDFDAFYAQCEIVRLGLPPITPLAVQQWNAIIALNYPARKSGLKRGVSVDDAKRICPELVLQHVPTWREGETTWAYRSDFAKHMSIDKSSLDPYRLQSRKCFEFIRNVLLAEPMQLVEKASIDEIFLDLSAQVYDALRKQYPELHESSSDLDRSLPAPSLSGPLVWDGDNVITSNESDTFLDWDDIALNIGASIVRKIRTRVLEQFHYTCSAGIARNKILAKLGASFKKPDQQTVILNQAIGKFLDMHDFTKIRGLGRKLGLRVADAFGSHHVADIRRASLPILRAKLGDEAGSWVYNVVRGHETSLVNPRIIVQSMLSAKTFVPNLTGFDQAIKWLHIFAADLIGRLNDLQAEYPRRPTIIALNHHIRGRFGPTRSKQFTIPSGSRIDESTLFTWTRDLLRQVCDEELSWPCASLSVRISGFESKITRNHHITSFFTSDYATMKRPFNPFLVDQEEDQMQTKKPKKVDNPTQFITEDNIPCASRAKSPSKTLGLLAHEEQSSREVGYECPHCRDFIVASEVLEHLDWHTAVDLQALDYL